MCRLWNLIALVAFILEMILSGLKVMAELLYNGIAALFLHGGDRTLIDRLAFDGTCRTLRLGGFLATRPQSGFLPGYLRIVAAGSAALGLLSWWLVR